MKALPSASVLLVAALWAASESPVADAAMDGDGERVRALVEEGADVNEPQGDGMTALHWAAERGDAGLAEFLLGVGADPRATTRIGAYTPLHLASRGGHAPVVRILLEVGSSVAAVTTTGAVTPLHFAASSGDLDAVEALLDAGADPDVIDSAWGQTPLMFAAAAGHTEAARALLRRGADPAVTARVVDMPARDELDRRDQRERNQRLAARLAGEQQPAPEATSEAVDINERQRDRQPVALSHAQLVGGYGGLTALLLAVREGHTETAQALLDGGADLRQASAGDGTPPLVMATINGHFDLAMELLRRGADPNQATDAGAAALYSTINTQWIPKSRHPQPTHYTQQKTTYLELMTAFLDAGADPNARLDKQLWYTTFGDDYLRVDRGGATPFWRAAYALDIEAMKLLVARGADPNIPTRKPPERRRRAGGAPDRYGEAGEDLSGLEPIPVGGPGAYPIHAASGVGYGEGFAANIHRHVPDGWLPAVRYLVEELGADVDARDHNGYTPLHHAAARGDNELILYLVEKGADVTAVSRKGQTTADMANGPVQRIPPFLDTVELLEGLGSENNHNCVSC